jgi:predicted acetylornithine/succinylornithine family transaminase
MHLSDALTLDDQYMIALYTRTPLLLTRGEGMFVWDDTGRRYLDFCSGGRAVGALGHCHPRVVAAIREQAGTLLHTSNDFYTEPYLKLAELLATRGACNKAFFCNSGAEANEAAIKLARKYGKQDSTERVEIVTALKSFHGRTMGAITATGQPKYQQGFEPLVPGFRYVPFNDLAAMDAAISARTCAVMLEPIQGESGVYPATQEYLAGVRALCDARGALLILDEVQTGLGRTGKFFAYEHYGITPDIITLSKALGGGMPIGAMLAKAEVAAAFARGDHATTFGGTAIAAAAGYAAVSTILDNDLPARAAQVGAYLVDRLAALRAQSDLVGEIRGLGCMVAVDLTEPVAGFVRSYAQEHELLILTVGDSMLRLLPAMICTPADVDTAVEAIAHALAAAPRAARA